MELNFDTFTAITRFLDAKDTAALATCNSTINVFHTYAIAGDAQLLSIYLNNVIKNCSTKDEVARHLDRFEGRCNTPLDLTCNNTEVEKLIPIKEKFQNLRSFSYIRQEILPPPSIIRRIAYYVITYIFHIFMISLSIPLRIYRFASHRLPLLEHYDFYHFTENLTDKLKFMYKRIEVAITKDASLELAASLYPRMGKLNISLIQLEDHFGYVFYTLPFLQNLQSLSFKTITPIVGNPRARDFIYEHGRRDNAFMYRATRMMNFTERNTSTCFPKQLKEISLRLCGEEMTRLFCECDALESLSYETGNDFNMGPIPRPYESLKKFKCSGGYINLQNLLLSFPNLEELNIDCFHGYEQGDNFSKGPIPRPYESLKKFKSRGSINLQNLLLSFPNLEELVISNFHDDCDDGMSYSEKMRTILREKCPNLEKVIVIQYDNSFKVPPQFTEVERGMIGDNEHYMCLKPTR
jgi:hypothetical protein